MKFLLLFLTIIKFIFYICAIFRTFKIKCFMHNFEEKNLTEKANSSVFSVF